VSRELLYPHIPRKKEVLFPHIPKSRIATAKAVYEYMVRIPVSYKQASTSAGRRYVRERMSEVRRRILEQCPEAEIRSGFVIGTFEVKCSKPIIAKDLGRGIEVSPF